MQLLDRNFDVSVAPVAGAELSGRDSAAARYVRMV